MSKLTAHLCAQCKTYFDLVIHPELAIPRTGCLKSFECPYCRAAIYLGFICHVRERPSKWDVRR